VTTKLGLVPSILGLVPPFSNPSNKFDIYESWLNSYESNYFEPGFGSYESNPDQVRFDLIRRQPYFLVVSPKTDPILTPLRLRFLRNHFRIHVCLSTREKWLIILSHLGHSYSHTLLRVLVLFLSSFHRPSPNQPGLTRVWCERTPCAAILGWISFSLQFRLLTAKIYPTNIPSLSITPSARRLALMSLAILGDFSVSQAGALILHARDRISQRDVSGEGHLTVNFPPP
jgi:hypothetical protein